MNVSTLVNSQIRGGTASILGLDSIARVTQCTQKDRTVAHADPGVHKCESKMKDNTDPISVNVLFQSHALKQSQSKFCGWHILI